MRKVDTSTSRTCWSTPRLRKVGGPAKVEVQALLRNVSRKDRDVTPRADRRPGERCVDAIPRRSPPAASRELEETFTITQAAPLAAGASRALRPDGRGRDRWGAPCVLPGDLRRRRSSRGRGGAAPKRPPAQPARRQRPRGRPRGGRRAQSGTRDLLVSRLRDLGATVTRSHYPLHPAFIEALDRAGILYWCTRPCTRSPTRTSPGSTGPPPGPPSDGAQQHEPRVDLHVVAGATSWAATARSSARSAPACRATSRMPPPRSARSTTPT